MKKVNWIELEHNGKNEKIALQRRFYGWQIVYPFNNEDGTKNLQNRLMIGGWAFTIKLIIFLTALLLFFYVYGHDTSVCRETMKNFGANCKLYLDELEKQARLETSSPFPLNMTLTIKNETT